MLRLLRDASAPLEMLVAGAVRPVQLFRSKELGHTISIDACH